MKIRIRRGRRRPLTDGSYAVVVQSAEHNLNWPVRVKLTEHGLAVWRQTRLERFSESWRNRLQTEADTHDFNQEFAREVARHHVGQGWYEFQAHQLWALFGKCFYEGMGLSANLPFETSVRYIHKKHEVSSRRA